jgi:hypothetical protein
MVESGFNISSLLASMTENDEDGENRDYESRLNLSVSIYLDGFPAPFSRATCMGCRSTSTVSENSQGGCPLLSAREAHGHTVDCAPCLAFFKSAIVLVRMADVIFLYLFYVLSILYYDRAMDIAFYTS